MTQPADEERRSPPDGDVRAPRAAQVELRVPARRWIGWIVGFCFIAEASFVVLDYHVNYGRLTEIVPLRQLANIAREDGLASWFGTTQTLMIALTLWLIHGCVRRVPASGWRRAGWLVLALLFTYMAVDDGAQVHERLSLALYDHAEAGGTLPSWISSSLDRFPSYFWQLVVLPLLAASGAIGLIFVWRELGSARLRGVVASAVACMVLAVALDFVEGLAEDHPWNVFAWLARTIDFGDWTEYRFRSDAFDTVSHFAKSAEETLEMVGNTLLWLAFLRYWTGTFRRVAVRFD
jgi:hypothetical protein